MRISDWSSDVCSSDLLRSAGLASLDLCEKRDTGKGEFWFAVVEKKGTATTAVLEAILPDALAALPWPKSMRWGSNALSRVRPLHSILGVFEGPVVTRTVARGVGKECGRTCIYGGGSES